MALHLDVKAGEIVRIGECSVRTTTRTKLIIDAPKSVKIDHIRIERAKK